jgi:hypothetical protein
VESEVQCPSGHSNSVEARFCRSCGAPLSSRVAEGKSESPPSLSSMPSSASSDHAGVPSGKGTSAVGGAAARHPGPQVPQAAETRGFLAGYGTSPSPDILSRPSRSTGMVVTILVLAVVLVGAGGVIGGIALSKHDTATPRPPGYSTATSPSNTSPPGTLGVSGTSGSGATTAPSTALPSNLTPVNTSAVSTTPGISQIALTFETYFGGINMRNFNQAYATYSPQYQSNVSEPSFASTDSTSTDSNVAITSVTDNPDTSVTAVVTFTSNQAASLGPNNETCTNWTLAYHLVSANGTAGNLAYLIDSASATGPGDVAC